jgi:homoserine O-acetyltransferase/O-succinyltransferase
MTQRHFARHATAVRLALSFAASLLAAPSTLAIAAPLPHADPAREGDVVLRDFQFHSGERLPELRLHYLALGRPHRDARGEVTNAVLILHGTGGSGRQFLSPQFADELYGPGAPLDTTRFWLVLPDGIGHGHSSKPSDGLHARFPAYNYDDMVEAQRRLLAEGLGVRHLKLVMGTSMGGMHTFVWGVTHPDLMDALMPLGCQPVAIVGRNRVWRAMAMDAIKSDPDWHGGEYTAQPLRALRTAEDLLLLAGAAPIPMQSALATRDSADRWLARETARRIAALDANDLLYQLAASRDYDPSPKLGAIRVPLVLVNSADDFINPPELGIAEREIKRIPSARFVLVPASERTHGHGTHTWAALWKEHLASLLAETAKP